MPRTKSKPTYGPALLHQGRAFFPQGSPQRAPKKAFPCANCKALIEVGKGFVQLPNGKKICDICHAELERRMMIDRGVAVLYLTNKTPTKWEITNFSGQLSYEPHSVRRSTGRGFGGRYPRYDVRFFGPDNKVWYGVQSGHNNQILRCRRLKRR